jgi:predicted nucleic acid-binding protein
MAATKSAQRIYVDTSVFGGCCDEEFADASRRLINQAKAGHFVLLFSPILAKELELAPTEVRAIVGGLPADALEPVSDSAEARRLRDLYLSERVVGPTKVNDAHHVALATVARAEMIVSWNFKDIVHYDKIRGFNAINLREGYPLIAIYSPLEIV